MEARGSWEVVLSEPLESLRGAYLVTGFRGFGMVGYMASKYLALAAGARKVGYLYSEATEPLILVEEDDVGFPHDLYLAEMGGKRILTVVNRALPEPGAQAGLVRAIAELAAKARVRLAILLGGLSREYQPEGDKFKYRWLKNTHYRGREPEAPRMEAGLGVVGPLALLFMALERAGVPALMVLPYSFVETPDYEAVNVAVKVVAGLVGVEVDMSRLERLVEAQRLEILRRLRELEERASREEEGGKGIYM